jgi:hypothetical protein
MQTQLSQQQIEDCRKNGFLVIDDFLDQEELAHLSYVQFGHRRIWRPCYLQRSQLSINFNLIVL